MRLRKLEIKDAERMLEWMHDDDVTKYLARNFSDMQLHNCIAFIENSKSNETDVHMAIVDENDFYMGTVSLKNIDKINKIAEFAITVRSDAQGKGYARYGMKELINYGLVNMGLDLIYWDVSVENLHAIRFYDKMGANLISDTTERKKYLSIMNISEDNMSEYLCYYMNLNNK